MAFDRDAAFAFQIHVVEHLVLTILAHRNGDASPAYISNRSAEGALAVVDMGDDAEIADILHKRRKSSFVLGEIFKKKGVGHVFFKIKNRSSNRLDAFHRLIKNYFV